jgi:hypothetical protein
MPKSVRYRSALQNSLEFERRSWPNSSDRERIVCHKEEFAEREFADDPGFARSRSTSSSEDMTPGANRDEFEL